MSNIEFSENELAAILSNYNLGEFRAASLLTSGTVQTNLLLETTLGRFVLKLYTKREFQSVQFEANLIHYLKARKYPCPAIFKDKQGKLVGVFKGTPYVLFEFVEGYHIENPDAAQKEQLIARVAELHILTRNYRSSFAEYRWNYTPGLCRKLAGDAAAQIATPEAQAKLKWLETILAELDLPENLPKGICHGDLHFSNVLFKDGRFAALLDFDDANLTYLLFDLVGLIEREAWRYELDEVLNFEAARQVVQAYARYRPLGALEKRHLFDVYKLSILIDCVWYFKRGNAADFFEKRKIDFLNKIGRESFYRQIFEIENAK